jgi:hypothetical protein
MRAVLRIRDVYPGSRTLIFTHPGSRIPDPKTATKERGEKKISGHTFLCSHKFHKIVNYFSFEVLKKKIWANFQRIRTFYQKNCQKALKKMVLGSGIRKKPIPDPGVKKHPIPDPGSATLHARFGVSAKNQ